MNGTVLCRYLYFYVQVLLCYIYLNNKFSPDKHISMHKHPTHFGVLPDRYLLMLNEKANITA